MFPDEWTNPFHRLCVMVLASHGSSFTFMLLGESLEGRSPFLMARFHSHRYSLHLMVQIGL